MKYEAKWLRRWEFHDPAFLSELTRFALDLTSTGSESYLLYIESVLDARWDVRRMQNQQLEPPYAIGGGVARSHPDIDVLTQAKLRLYPVDYHQQPTVVPKISVAASLPTPKSEFVTINGTKVKLVAFYFPGQNTEWDTAYQAPFLGNFWPCPITIVMDNINGRFHNAEAAFQATKWWHNCLVRKQFEDAKTGEDAFKIKRFRDDADLSYSGLGRDEAMMKVLTTKFNLPDFKAALLATGDAYLLEHNVRKGRDDYWSDDYNGRDSEGKPKEELNMLGKALMKIRKQLGGKDAPCGNYTVADFSKHSHNTSYR